MRYVYARYENEAITHAYRVYVTDSLYLRAEGKMFSERWCNLINPERAAQAQKSGDEIVEEVMARAGLKFGG